jgi:hypothetical protein
MLRATFCQQNFWKAAVNGGGMADEQIAEVVRQVARLEKLGPNVGTLEALQQATGYDREALKALLAQAHSEGRVSLDIAREVWTISV